MVKGAGYALEAIVAVATVFIFVVGTLTIPANQEWSQFREEVSAEDLTYAIQQTDYVNHALKNGETGSLQTAFSTITEKDIEVSGLVSNLPINENKVAFYITNSNRYTASLTEVGSGDDCEDDLEEISNRSEEPVLRSVNSAPVGTGNQNTTYIGDLDPNTVGGNNEEDYDSLWVDNGTECQFSSAEGPYNIEEIFKWEDEYYDFKWVEQDDRMRIYHATQPVNFRENLTRRVNDVETFITIDTVNFTRLDSREYNTVVFLENQSLDDIDSSSGNRKIVEDFLQTGSILFLADLDDSYFETGDFLSDAGFQNVSVDYVGTNWNGGSFSDGTGSQEVKTYFQGLEGKTGSLSIEPSTKVISDSEFTLQSGRAILKSSENYNFSEWNVKTESMSYIDNTSVQGEPPSDCYWVGGDQNESALTEETLVFPENEYSVINARLGTSDSYCKDNDDRAIKIDLDDDGDYTDSNEGPFLNGEPVIVDNREYGVKIPPYDSNSGVGCGDYGKCVEFIFTGDRSVELIPRRTSFPALEGQKIALTGYESTYEKDDMKVLVATINWLRGDQVRFTGNQDPEDISTTTVSSINNETYMPFKLNLRWSR